MACQRVSAGSAGSAGHSGIQYNLWAACLLVDNLPAVLLMSHMERRVLHLFFVRPCWFLLPYIEECLASLAPQYAVFVAFHIFLLLFCSVLCRLFRLFVSCCATVQCALAEECFGTPCADESHLMVRFFGALHCTVESFLMS